MELTILARGLGFPEGPRWHQGKFYFSDFSHQVVRSIDLDGQVEVVARVPAQPSGLGWLPDGRMLVVSMADKKVLHQEADGTLVEHADMSGLTPWVCNDMVVDIHGRAYVGNFGDSTVSLESTISTNLIRVDTDGTVSVAAEDLNFPNGAVITPDGKTLIVAETMGQRLSAFDIDGEGRLHNRRIWADTAPLYPDGICLDAEGGIWVATIFNQVARVVEGGQITETIDTDRGCYACALGGETGHTLYLCLAGSPSGEGPAEGQIASIEVAVPAPR